VFSLSVLSPNARRRTLLFSLFLSLSAGAIARIVLEKRKERERESWKIFSRSVALSPSGKRRIWRDLISIKTERESDHFDERVDQKRRGVKRERRSSFI